MLTTVQPQSETSGENSIPISSITPLSVSNEDLSVSNSETMTTDPKLSADSRMKVDDRDPAEPDSNEGTEGLSQQNKSTLSFAKGLEMVSS